MQPAQPRLKLLGGSSKLAKLAEERRKKAAASQRAETKPNSSLSALDRLSKTHDAKENATPTPKPEPKKYPIRKKKESTPPPQDPEPPPEDPKEGTPDLRTSPSDFGRTLSITTGKGTRSAQMALDELFGRAQNGDAFSGPSPDDTVLKAQGKSKGLNK